MSYETTLFQGGVELSRHTPVYLGQYSRWYPADASDANKMPAIGLTLEPMRIGQQGTVLLSEQMIEDENWNWVPGKIIYVSTVAGGLAQTPPSTPGSLVQVFGVAITNTLIMFKPTYVLVEVTQPQ